MRLKNFNLSHKTNSLLSCIVCVLLAIMGVTGFTSCSCDPKAAKPADYRIASINNEPRTYYSDNRINTIGNTVYSYTANEVKVNGETAYTLNPQGYIESEDGNSPSKKTYTYDTQGHRIKGENQLYTDTFTYDDKGNCVKWVRVRNNTPFTLTYTYEYDEQEDKRIDGMDWYHGKRSTNLPKKINVNGGFSKYEYTTDNRGRVTEMLEPDSKFGSNTVTYTYFN